LRRVALAAAAACALAGPATAGKTPPVTLQVTAREYNFVLSNDSVRAGMNKIELVNFGQDPHNLVLKRGSTEITSVLVPAGQRTQFLVKLKTGEYELYCSLLDHQARGMDTTLKVKRKRKR
jgi:plastocyanin